MFFATSADLFTPHAIAEPSVVPWKPYALDHDQWPPDYRGVYAWRVQTLDTLRRDPVALASAKAYYAQPGKTAEFIMHWMDTYNPRKIGSKWMPFVLFSKQEWFVQFLEELDALEENGLVEKCRDIGATWLASAYSVKKWLFERDDATGWGSRKQELVDKLGDPDSIFEKMRLLIKRLPDIWLPDGFRTRDHATFMKLINPENGSTITGESGDNIGRGGRKKRYFKDEAQPLHSLILTPYGWQTMGDMQPGSLVIGANGRCRVVTAINDCGSVATYRITLRDGTTAECSENHLWSVMNRRKRKNKTLSLAKLMEKYRYTSPGGQTQFRYYLPTTQPVQFWNETTLPLNPYVVGVLLGDGSVNSGSVSFTSADIEIVGNVSARLPYGCIVSGHDNGTYGFRIVDARGKTGQGVRSRAREAVRLAGIAGHLAHEKFIPDQYKFASIDDRLSLLQGLMDTDGSASSGTTTYHTCSRRLADDVRFIVQSLGGVASLNVKPDHRGYRDMFVLHVDLPQYMPLFKLQRKNNLSVQRKSRFDRSIVNIERIHDQVCRCITIDAPDGLYLTDSFIVTHNSAHYERPEKIEAALGDNTNVQIDMSSVNGLGNVFHRRRESSYDWSPGAVIPKGETRVFVFDWRDHPEKTQEWYDRRKAKAEREGMQHVFAQEVDRNYSAAVQNTVISYEWLQACIDAHLKVPYLRVEPPNVWMAGLDVADEGLDRNAQALRQWIILRDVQEWGERDPGVTARRSVDMVRHLKGIKVQYDSIGIGSNIKAEYNRLCDEQIITPQIVQYVAWNAGAAVVNPYERIIPDDDNSLFNKDFYANFKAQAWWSLRSRVYKTYRAVVHGDVYPADELISFDSSMPLLMQLLKELAQPVSKPSAGLKTMIDKKPPGTKSPNLADAVVMVYFPAQDDSGYAIVGGYSG